MWHYSRLIQVYDWIKKSVENNILVFAYEVEEKRVVNAECNGHGLASIIYKLVDPHNLSITNKYI